MTRHSSKPELKISMCSKIRFRNILRTWFQKSRVYQWKSWSRLLKSWHATNRWLWFGRWVSLSTQKVYSMSSAWAICKCCWATWAYRGEASIHYVARTMFREPAIWARWSTFTQAIKAWQIQQSARNSGPPGGCLTGHQISRPHQVWQSQRWWRLLAAVTYVACISSVKTRWCPTRIPVTFTSVCRIVSSSFCKKFFHLRLHSMLMSSCRVLALLRNMEPSQIRNAAFSWYSRPSNRWATLARIGRLHLRSRGEY